jgi:LysM repeat protein
VKPFIVFLFFACALVTIITGIIGDSDLTPDTPPAPGGSSASGAQALPAPNQPGVCPSTYTIQSGNTMSQIAKTCGLTLADLSAANPQIPDPDLIYVGQTIQIPAAPVQVVVAFTATPVPQLYAIPPTAQPAVLPGEPSPPSKQ